MQCGLTSAIRNNKGSSPDAAIGNALVQETRDVTLVFADALDLDRHCVQRLLKPRQAIGKLNRRFDWRSGTPRGD